MQTNKTKGTDKDAAKDGRPGQPQLLLTSQAMTRVRYYFKIILTVFEVKQEQLVMAILQLWLYPCLNPTALLLHGHINNKFLFLPPFLLPSFGRPVNINQIMPRISIIVL